MVTKATATAATTEAATETAAKVYKLTSRNKFLTVSSLKVQFVKGKYQTTDAKIARALLTIDGVELVEE